MTEGVRHLVGAIAGVVLTPVIFFLVLWGTDRLLISFQLLDLESGRRWAGAALIALAALLVGLLTTSFVSPLGSLASGFGFLILGFAHLVSPTRVIDVANDVLPSRTGSVFVTVSAFGLWLLIGIVLLVASTSPSRWRPHTKPAPDRSLGPPPPGYGAYPYPSSAPTPPHAPPATPERR